MIDNSLTVKIEKDLFDTTGKKAPKYVNRLGSNVENSPTSAQKLYQRPYTTMSKSANKYSAAASAKKTALDMRLHD